MTCMYVGFSFLKYISRGCVDHVYVCGFSPLKYIQRECEISIELSKKYCTIWTHVFEWYVYFSVGDTKMVFSFTNTNCLAKY